MKIVAGFGSIDAYPMLAETGADELFCGYVPFEDISSVQPVNRREVRAANVQIGSESELIILSEMMKSIGVPVSITFNALCYTPERLKRTCDLIEQCMAYGFERFIIADPALAVHIQNRHLPALVHISGELGEMNRRTLEVCRLWGAHRIIFHRRMSIEDMRACINACPQLEYEAFALNELCHFHGGYCNTLHCDALDHMCRVPYRIDGNPTGCREYDSDALGAGGCGLCALYQLQQAGVTHLKIVSRGNFPELTLCDVAAVKQALGILSQAPDEGTYIRRMKKEMFRDSCPQNCYYLPKT